MLELEIEKFLYKDDYDKKRSEEKRKMKNAINAGQSAWRIVLTLFLLSCVSLSLVQQGTVEQVDKSIPQCQSMLVVGHMETFFLSASNHLQVGNFWARYVHGNKIERKGITNSHLNIRSLRYKVVEIKNIIKEQKIHMIGLSECELKKGPNFNLKELKIPGYDLLLPHL